MTQENAKLVSAVINTLNGISMPSVFTESVIIPIYNCSKVLQQILDKESKTQKNEDSEEPPKEEITNDTADSAE